MRTQLALAIQNFETVISQAGYECRDIVRLTIYTTSSDEFIKNCFDLFKDSWPGTACNSPLPLMQVVALYETLNVELEATVVK
jgi:enamine deaminase RidA (YjgF/YER057c/UK114 family)